MTLTDISSMSGIEFENLCQLLMIKMNFEVETTKASGDGGIDLIAYNHQPFTQGKYIVQCKRYTGSVGEPVIRDLYGVVMSERANKGILITTGTITASAFAFANGKPIELIDGDKLQSLLFQNNILNESLTEDTLFSLEDILGCDFLFEEYCTIEIDNIEDKIILSDAWVEPLEILNLHNKISEAKDKVIKLI